MAQSLSLKALLTLFCAFLLQLAVAAPAYDTSLSTFTSEVNARSLFKRYVGTPRCKDTTTAGGPDTSDYPADADITTALKTGVGPYVFYSGISGDGSTSDAPYKFAQQEGGVILRTAFTDSKYMNRNKRSVQWLPNFFDRASGVYAENAPGSVYFVTTFDSDTIQEGSIWNRIELPTLMANANVQTITLVDYTNFNNQRNIYTRSASKREVDVNVLTKRDDACNSDSSAVDGEVITDDEY